jgi:hypothetical protein
VQSSIVQGKSNRTDTRVTFTSGQEPAAQIDSCKNGPEIHKVSQSVCICISTRHWRQYCFVVLINFNIKILHQQTYSFRNTYSKPYTVIKPDVAFQRLAEPLTTDKSATTRRFTLLSFHRGTEVILSLNSGQTVESRLSSQNRQSAASIDLKWHNGSKEYEASPCNKSRIIFGLTALHQVIGASLINAPECLTLRQWSIALVRCLPSFWI